MVVALLALAPGWASAATLTRVDEILHLSEQALRQHPEGVVKGSEGVGFGSVLTIDNPSMAVIGAIAVGQVRDVARSSPRSVKKWPEENLFPKWK